MRAAAAPAPAALNLLIDEMGDAAERAPGTNVSPIDSMFLGFVFFEQPERHVSRACLARRRMTVEPLTVKASAPKCPRL